MYGSDNPLFVRNPPSVYKHLKNARVGIAGCGGIGSNCAVILARCGIGNLVLADHDRVELSNLNRQVFTRRHVGMRKVDALAEIIREIRSEITLELHADKMVTSENTKDLFAGCQVLIEAFDTVESKSMIMRSFMDECFSESWFIGTSGIAGIGPESWISSHRIGRRIFVCGDMRSDVADEGVLAPRVVLTAACQANLTVRLLCGLEAEDRVVSA